jgi:hypothetical protein
MEKKCVIVTTINKPSDQVKYYSYLDGWDLIIVGDSLTRKDDFNEINCVYLGLEEQKNLYPTFYDIVPLKSYTRKMFGYLYAINNNYNVIYDTDDDNQYFKDLNDFRTHTLKPELVDASGFVNLYKLYTDKHIWPRGIPKNHPSAQITPKTQIDDTNLRPTVIQGLVNNDPDVDAIYRLENNVDGFVFEKNLDLNVKLQKYSVCPINTQNTFWFDESDFYLLYLPTTVSFRYTDILKGVIALYQLWKKDKTVVFTSATAIQLRNFHDLQKDLESERVMYDTIEDVINILNKNKSATLFEVYTELYKNGIVKESELNVLSEWLHLTTKKHRIFISDFHAGCQMWQISVLEKLNYEVVLQSFSGHATFVDDKYKQTVINSEINIKNLTENCLCDDDISRIEKFDTCVVSFPPKFIDIFSKVKFKIPPILNCAHRLHIHAENDPDFLRRLKEKVQNKSIILCSMSKYDTEYIKHYLGITPIELEVVCFHIPYMLPYKPCRSEILVGPCHARTISPFSSLTDMNIKSREMGYNFTFGTLYSLYGRFSYENILAHPAVVIFPYSIFSISMVEMYELNIPMFVPCPKLLVEMGLLNDVSLYPCYFSEEQMKQIDIPSKFSHHKYSPNSYCREDQLYWLNFSYFVQKENVIFWNDTKDLFEKLNSTDMEKVSNLMREENNKHRETQVRNWKKIFAQYTE